MATTYLYRLLDHKGRLLYVGISNGPIYRLFQHLEEKPWAPQITWQHVEPYDNRELAAEAERQTIELERPLYNIQFNNDEHAARVKEMYERHRQELFELCRQYAIPKDASLSVGNARQLIRGMTGKTCRFTKEDWQAWCQEPLDEIGQEWRGTHD